MVRGTTMHAEGVLERTDRSGTDPVFEPTRGTLPDRVGSRFDGRPVLTAVLLWLGSFVILAAVIVGVGLLLTHVLLPDGVSSIDGSVARWFVRQRTSTLDLVTRIGSDLGSTAVVIGVAAVALIVLAIGRHWRQAGFLFCALSLEFTVFLLSTILIDRHRPTVPRLDSTPPTSSYPSGHTAASIALYVGLAIVIWSLVRSAAIRTIAWIIAVAIPVIVALSRLYRGMHHLTDVLASVLLGAGALLLALLVTRGTVASAEHGEDDRVRNRPDASTAEASR